MEETLAMGVYTKWINKPGVDPEMRQELMGIISSPEEIESRFSKNLNFGTAGLRAVMAGGTNRMNIYTVAAAAKAFAEMIVLAGEADMGVLISYDSRNNSRNFAEVTARVMAAAGIKVLLSDGLRPVPMLSYGVRMYGTSGGVMITASHNPKEYNGFKVYGDDGGQLCKHKCRTIKTAMNQIDPIDALDGVDSLEAYISDGKVTLVGEEWDKSYDNTIHNLSDSKKIRTETKANLRIVYSPMNGSGYEHVRRILRNSGFTKTFTVTGQEYPDGDFSTVGVPNPELEASYGDAIKFATAVLGDVVILTDPDADRLGVAIPDAYGKYQILSGNQIGILLMEYILSTKKAAGTMPENPFCITSYVSSSLARRICARYGVKLYETPTGSRYAAEIIKEKDDNGDENFVFGFEESHGYMFGKDVRDKDAIAASVAIAEMAALSKSYGKKLYEQLQAIYSLYGYASERNFAITRSGFNGQEEIRKVVDHYRALDGKLGAPGQDLYYQIISKYIDLLPESDTLIYELNDMDWIALRPSGTEPKLKVYFGFYGDKYASASRLARYSKKLLADIEMLF